MSANAEFSFSARFRRIGRYAVRAAYIGDTHHRPSGASVSVRVTA